MSHLRELRWSIVEQKHFVECGKEHFEDESLRFYESIESCIAKKRPDVVVLSGVLSYLEKPYETLEALIALKTEYIIVDRTPFLLCGSPDRLTVQRVPPSIYEASYPAWFFNKQLSLSFFKKKYELIVEANGLDVVNIPSQFLVFLIRLRKNG